MINFEPQKAQRAQSDNKAKMPFSVFSVVSVVN